jgi:hypothetical protein
MKHPITIARKKDLTDYESLCRHPKIIKFINLPHDYVLFEFWDPLFEEIFGKNVNDISHNIYTDPELKRKAILLSDEERSFIEPLYRRETLLNGVSAFGFTINNNYYLFNVLRSERLIKLGDYFDNKILEPECLIKINFKNLDIKKQKAFEKVIIDWHEWTDSLNIKTNPGNITYSEKVALFTATFKEGFEDAYATLIIMFNETKLKTGCASFSFEKQGSSGDSILNY